MDDDKINPDKNQPSQDENSSFTDLPQPIFETVPTEDKPTENLTPEEVSPEYETAEEIGAVHESNSLISEKKTKYFIIAGAGLFFIVLFIFILRLIFAGAGTAKETKLVYWGLWEDQSTVQPLIQEYQKKHKNIRVEYLKMAPQDYREKLITRGKNGQGPDIFRFHNTWLPEIKEVAAPLPASVMSNDEFEKTFYPIHQKDLLVQDKYHGIPLGIDGLVLVYNDGLFKKAGLTTAPLTWEDIIDYVAKLTVKNRSGEIITSGIALGTANNIEHFSDIFGLFLVQNGGDIKKLDQPEAAGALESYRKFAEPPNTFWDETMPNSINAFVQEKVAMIIVPSWQILAIKSANPDIDLKVSSVPTIPGSKPVSIASYWVEGVSKFSKNQIEAWKFLRFLAEKENMTKVYELQSRSRLFGVAYSRVDLKPLLDDNEYLGAVMKQAEAYVSLPTITRTFDGESGLNDGINKYIENAINAAAQGVSYEEAVDTLKQGVDQIFTRYQIQ